MIMIVIVVIVVVGVFVFLLGVGLWGLCIALCVVRCLVWWCCASFVLRAVFDLFYVGLVGWFWFMLLVFVILCLLLNSMPFRKWFCMYLILVIVVFVLRSPVCCAVSAVFLVQVQFTEDGFQGF